MAENNDNDVLEEFYVRIRDPETAEKFDRLQDELDEIRDNYSDSRTGAFAIRLAAEVLDEKENLEETIREAANL